MSLDGVKITWLGHATFLIETPGGKKLLVDPWLAGNPSCPKEFHEVESDAILVTHGHFDHIGDLLPAIERCSGSVVAIFEITHWLQAKHGVAAGKLQGMNKGGTIALDDLDVSVTFTDARHSSAWAEEDGSLTYLGEAGGFIVGFENDQRLYIAGDTCVFGDMALIAQLWAPKTAILPIGDRFTMDPRQAAVAASLLEVERVIPCHYGTFPLLTGTPDGLREAIAESSPAKPAQVIELAPGETTS